MSDNTPNAEPKTNKGRLVAYWISTALIAFVMGAGGVIDILRPPEVVEAIEHLGYPPFFPVMLGIWKVLGTLTVLAPRLPRLKEWAYAGFIIDLVGASASHAAAGDAAADIAFPAALILVVLASHGLRPASRKL